MRTMPIQVFTGASGATQLKAAFRKNWKHYLQEALGLGIFMISACFFSAMIFSPEGAWHSAIAGDLMKNVVTGFLMGATALFIFYSRWTAPSGSHINPAVTLAFLRLGRMCRYDALFFIIFQVLGGTLAVYVMQLFMGEWLTAPPVSSAVTIPGKAGMTWAAITEFIIAFITMTMVLFTALHNKLKQYTRIFSGMLVCCWVIIAGPVSGFGMNPARSFASALPAGIWASFWIYCIMPVAGMLCAAEIFLLIQRKWLVQQKKVLSYTAACICAIFISLVSFSQVTKVESIGITVKDLDRSVKFYTEVLGFKKINETAYQGADIEQLNGLFGINVRTARLQLGEEIIELTDYLTTGGRSIPEDQKSNDLFFQHIAIVVSDMDKAYAHLRKYNVEHVSTAPQTLPKSIPAAEGIKAFYFHDPDNHNLELIYFPAGKGADKWQQRNGSIFLGIDHTAIGVSSTNGSHDFYMGLLGIQRKGESWNKGIEQEHLNNVEGASLHITGYRAAEGPGIEFLEYLKPGPGKVYPPGSRADDLWHWQTTLVVNNAQELFNKLKSTNAVFISKALTHQQLNGAYTRSFIVRDPDGHALLIKEYLSR
jgi:glycerol uptake facilitator-like aquaporin/catechol 2,3-dioxygenase-like lactoylglutathione lyase family enzyme